jgi:hypothetical protein
VKPLYEIVPQNYFHVGTYNRYICIYSAKMDCDDNVTKKSFIMEHTEYVFNRYKGNLVIQVTSHEKHDQEELEEDSIEEDVEAQ